MTLLCRSVPRYARTRRRRGALRLALLTAATAVAIPPAAATGVGQGRIEVVADSHGPIARVAVAGCSVALESERSERGLYLRYRNDCDQPLADKLALLGALAGALAGGPPPQKVTLFAGRIVKTFPDIALEAARAAAVPSAWDSARARTEPGYANAAYAALVGGAPSAQLLAGTLSAWPLRLAHVSVEKVLAAKPGRTPFADALAGAGVVPFDALTYFVFEPAAGP